MIDRRTIITTALAAIAGPVWSRTALAQAAMSRITAYAFSFPALAGGDIRLADYAGRPLLVVNTASLCGYTPQYAGLQELWTQFHDRGLMIIGVPSNDFGGQEPGGATEIAETAQHGRRPRPPRARQQRRRRRRFRQRPLLRQKPLAQIPMRLGSPASWRSTPRADRGSGSSISSNWISFATMKWC
jgi:hypothetical protein